MTVSNLFLFKRPNGFWYIIYDADGRRKWKSTRFTEKSEALKKLTEFKGLTKEKPTSSKQSRKKSQKLIFANHGINALFA